MTMSATYASNRQVPLGAVSIFRATSAAEGALRALTAWRRARSTRLALAKLSDAQLNDIGVRRGDILDLSGALARR